MTAFNGTLDVTIADAQVSTIRDLSKEDPYCYVTLGSSGMKNLMEGSRLGKEIFQTKPHSGGGQHPVWSESHTFDLKNMKLDSHLKVKLYTKNTLKDSCIGVATIDLKELHLQDNKGIKYYNLLNQGVLGQEKSESIGQVGVSVKFNCTEIPSQSEGKTLVVDEKEKQTIDKEKPVIGTSESPALLPRPETNLLGQSEQQATLPHPEGPGVKQQTLQSMTHPPQIPTQGTQQ